LLHGMRKRSRYPRRLAMANAALLRGSDMTT
jgi:hypothetical protein